MYLPLPRVRAGYFLTLLMCSLTSGALAEEPDADGFAFFEKNIRPVLVERCYQCHSAAAQQAKKLKGGLLLDTRDGVRTGGESGPAIVPGLADESLLVDAIRYEGPKMPPDGKLPDATIADFVHWIEMGAPDPRDPAASEPTSPSPIKGSTFWSLLTPQAFDPPATRDTAWPTGDIDHFLLAKLESAGLSPAAPADRRTLIRRATFDLTGLPPTPDEIQAFVSDSSPDAFDRVVDRLLDSPHYGERWGRHWLDVVRYADTAGETADFPVPDAWRYRNYVIDVFNHDKPFDEFIREQIAGDILASRLPADAPRTRYAELVTATGYIAIARRFGFQIDKDQYLTIDDTIDTLGKSVLGLTIGCARCHDHKYDPITSADYYALYGIFDSTRYPFPGCEHTKQPRDLVALAPAEEVQRTEKPAKTDVAYAVAEGGPHNSRRQRRGDPDNLGEEIPRRFLAVLGGQVVPSDAGSGRLQLAEWLTSAGNPLTARVFVNRVWQHHFTVGLVQTPNDFGTRGQPPTHPELLDYLARQFVADGWSVKRLHRRIMLSSAYQMSGRGDPKAASVNPENTLLWSFPRRRLSVEEIRDSMLAASGGLDRTPGAAHPFPPPDQWGFTQHNPFVAVYPTNKRSIYLMTQRNKRHPLLALFDGPDPNSSTPVREATTVPTQSLFFMNSPFVHEQADRLASQLVQSTDEATRLDHAYQMLFARAPDEEEQKHAAMFLKRYQTELSDVAAESKMQTAWAAYVRVLMSTNEFVYVD